MKFIFQRNIFKTLTKSFLFLWAFLTLTGAGLIAQNTSFSIDPLMEISEGAFAPLRIALDASGSIYVTDANTNLISKYDNSGNFLESIHTVDLPISVAINNEDMLFIGDGATGSIFSYSDIQGVTEFYSGTSYPTSMEFDLDNNLYISDSELQQVVVVDLSGNVIRTIGSGTLDFPTGITLDNNNKRILVGEHGGKGTGFSPVVKVWMFDFQGNLIKSFGSHGNTDGKFYRIQGISIGKCGDIYVVDPFLARVSIFDEEGVFKTKFGDWGTLPGQLNIPMDVIFDSQERLLVTSMNNSNIELYGILDTLPCANITSESITLCAEESTDIIINFEGTAPWICSYTNGIDTLTINTSESPYILSVSDPGHYEILSLSDANYTGNCFSGSVDVTIATENPTSDMTGDAIICNGDTADISIAFTGTSPWSFTYTTNLENPWTVTTTNNPHILKVSEAGYYEIIGLTDAGCTGSSFSGSANITVNPLPTATITEGNAQILADWGDTTDLTIAFTGTGPWEMTYTIDDLNPASINNINTNPYILKVTEAGTYEISDISDVSCTNPVTSGFPEIVLFSLPVAEDDNVFTNYLTQIEIDVINNDYDLDGVINPATINIIDQPLTGILEVQPNGSITFTPDQESCNQEIFTYNVADNSGFISNPATVTITIIDNIYPVFHDLPDDITVTCKEIPNVAILTATDNCDFDVNISFLGETIKNSCDEGYYTIIRKWSATDNSNNSTFHTQLITVDTKFYAGCFTVNLVSAEYSESENKTTFIWELYANHCAKGLSSISFKLPDYIVAQDPPDNLLYTYQENSYQYSVSNPYGSIKKGNYGIQFTSFESTGFIGQGIKNGGPEVFTYSYEGGIKLDELTVWIKSGKDLYEVSKPLFGCSCNLILPEKSQNMNQDFQDYESLSVKAFPNPFTNKLFFEFQAPFDSYGRLDIFDITGAKVCTLFEGNLTAGQKYKVTYNPDIISSGLIFYKLITEGKIKSGKVIYSGK